MKTRYFLLLAAMGLLASCTRETVDPQDAVSYGKTVIRVGLGSDTRTYMDAEKDAQNHHKMYWSAGDQIGINGQASEALGSMADPAQSASFTFNAALETPYKVIYPASLYTDATHVTLPATQTWRAGGFDDGMFPMAGYAAADGEVSLSSLCALVKVSVLQAASDADTDDIASVRFNGRSDEQVSGLFTIDYQAATLTGASTAAADKAVEVANTQATSTSTAVEYFLTVPAGTYADGFDIVVKDASNHTMTKSKTGSVTLQAGKFYNLAAFEFVPNGTELGIEISNAAELVQFAEDFNARVYPNSGEGLTVTLTDDIAFDATTSAAFNATGGIGLKNGVNADEDYYFSGTFDGGSHTISGLNATAPVFCATGSDGVVKDLIVDESCSFTFTHKNTSEAFFGAIAGYHKGSIEGVTVKADVTLAAVDGVEYMTSLGGLVGRATTGSLENCTYSGLVSTPTGFTATAPDDDPNLRKIIIGGLVGRFSNAGSISYSYFKGAISNEAQAKVEDENTDNSLLKRNPFLIIGGIVGHLDGGASVSFCHSTDDHETVTTLSSSTTAVGHIVIKSAVAYFSVAGGIVGEINKGTVSNCTNSALIFNTIFKASDNDSRYLYSGGIVGKNNANGTIDGCTNNAKVQHRANPRIQDLGGIAGNNAGTVSACINNAAVNHMTTGVTGATKKGGRVVNIAGIIGENAATATVSNVHNTADIQISAMESGTKSEARMGGIVAYNLADIDGGSSKNITNTGMIYFNTNFAVQFLGYELGGIAGYSQGSIQNAQNSGAVVFNWGSDANVASLAYLGGIVGKMDGNGTISGCINNINDSEGNGVNVAVKAGSAKHTENFAGGILGYSTKDVTISDCMNYSKVQGGNSTANNGATFYAGGIVAYLSGASSIADCTNSGIVYNNQRNNTDTNVGSTYNGGIAAYLKGTSENHITVEGCNNTAEGMFSRRGWLGGIVGYADYADISGCSFNKDVTLACLSRGIGGIIGWGENTTLTSCNYTGAELSATQIQANRAGGIAGRLDNGSVTGCNSSVETFMSHPSSDDIPVDGGAIIGISNTNTVTNCHYKSTINGADANIVGTGEFTGEGNAADL